MNDYRYARPNNFPPVVKSLIIINVLVLLAQITIGRQYDLTNHIVLYPFTDPDFRVYQVITHMFAHAPNNYFHILFNMFALYMFGRILEDSWGPKRFLNFYLLCGIGAAVFHLMVEYFQGGTAAALGASGAVMGVAVGFAYQYPNTNLYLMFIPIPIKAKWAITAYVVYDIVFGIAGGDNIAHFAHIGGAITGFILAIIWNKSDKKRFY